jgi:hypothetical protein
VGGLRNPKIKNRLKCSCKAKRIMNFNSTHVLHREGPAGSTTQLAMEFQLL